MVETLKFVGSALVSAAVVTGLLGAVLNALIKWSRSKGAANSNGAAAEAQEAVRQDSEETPDQTGKAAAYLAV